MSATRIVRWLLLLLALIISITWSYISITHLLASSMAPGDRTAQYDSTSDAIRVHQMDLSQQHWGRHTMFAIACSFLFLLATIVNWVLDGREPPANFIDRN